MDYRFIQPPGMIPGGASKTAAQFQPTRKKPMADKTKYIIEGKIYYLISKDALERDALATAEAAVKAKKEEILEINRKELEKEAKRYREAAKKEADDYWNDLEAKFRSADSEENFMNMLQYHLSVGCRVLVEHFGWKPIPKDGIFDRRHKLMKYVDLVVHEIQDVCEDETKDIMTYAQETFDLYGCKFEFKEPEETETYEFEERKK